MRSWVTVFGAVALLGCGGGSTVGGDAGAPGDLGSPGDRGASGDQGGAGSDAGVCDVGTPPVPAGALPRVRAAMVIVGGDAGVATPTASGGDATGRWVMEGGMMYLPAGARGQIDETRSSLEGTGWGEFGADGSYRLSSQFELRLETTQVGRVVTPTEIAGRGRFTARGPTLDLTPDCTVGASGGRVTGFAFSRDAIDRGRLFALVAGPAGMATIVFDLRRVP